jgi:hypothetical protein
VKEVLWNSMQNKFENWANVIKSDVMDTSSAAMSGVMM